MFYKTNNTKLLKMYRSYLLILTVILFMIQSCNDQNEQANTDENSNLQCDQNSTLNQPCISPNQFVIRYKRALTPNEKTELRGLNNVATFDTCSCGDSNLELWTIDTTYFDIEKQVTGLSSEEESDADIEGDHQFTISVTNEYKNSLEFFNTEFSPDMLQSEAENTFNIAIIDTGIDYGNFESPFLYNSGDRSGCNQETSGWNFVNGNNEVQDDNSHGTYVSRIIANQLDSLKVPYRLLPVKVFDQDGKGSYWNVVCAMSYLKNLEDIHVVNMSFGYGNLIKPAIMNGLKQPVILEEIITEVQNQIVVVASAGNEGIDTDLTGQEHYPSGYSNDNIISVAGYTGLPLIDGNNIRNITLATNSNYGATSIDIVTPYDNFELNRGLFTKAAAGTSFSAAFLTGRLGAYFDFNNHLPRDLKSELFSQSQQSSVFAGKILDQRVLIRE